MDSFNGLGISFNLGRAPNSLIFFWHPPFECWIRADSDSPSKYNPVPSACGALFRNYFGRAFWGFWHGYWSQFGLLCIINSSFFWLLILLMNKDGTKFSQNVIHFFLKYCLERLRVSGTGE